MKHDAIYARYSSHAQDDSTSIEVQIEQCEKAAGGVCKHYIDAAKTGRATAHRAQLLTMLADAAAGKLGRVFIYKFDRLGRDAETHMIARDLEEHGVELISATEGTNALARGIQLVVAEDYSRQLANRTRDGLLKRFEQKAFTGGVAPYGYRVVTREGKRTLEVDPNESAIVREVAHWYLTEAVGFKIIARRLRQRGIGSRRGKGWCFTSVRSLLVNPILTGCMRFNFRKMVLNRTTGRRVPRRKASADVLERQDEALRILDDATFAAIDKRMEASRHGGRTRPAPRGVAPFTGLVYCQCGAKCHRVKSKNAKGEYYYYLCSRRTRYDDCPYGHRVREDYLLTQVQDRFAGLERFEDRIIARALEIATEAVRSNRGDADRIKGELAEVEARQARLVELLVDRAIPDAAKVTIGREMGEAEERRTMLLAALDGLREQATADTEGLAGAVRQAFQTARESLAAAATPEQLNRLIEDFVGPMTIQADGTIAQKKSPQAEAKGDLLECIAGGRYHDKRKWVRAGIWAEAA